MISKEKKKIVSRLAYASGTFGHDVFYAMFSTCFMIFVTSNLFNSNDKSYNEYMIGIVTSIILILRIGELFIDPFIGNVVDKTKTRWGKFKPWVISGACIAAITLAILFTNMGGLTSSPITYLCIFTILYLIMDVFYSAKDVALWSMIPAISFDSREREITASFARIGCTLGAQFVAVLVMPIVLYFSVSQNGGAGDSTGWFMFAVIGGTIATIGAVILGIGTKEHQSKLRENKRETSFKDVFKILVKNDQLLWLALAYLLFGIGFYIVNNFNIYYFIYILGDATQFSFLGIINVIVGIPAIALFPTLTRKFKRRKLFISAIIVMIVALVIYSFAGTNVYITLLAASLFALPQPLIFLVALMTITDCVEYGQLKLGHRDEALILCIRPLMDKLSSAISGGIIGLTAVWVGMTGQATVDSIAQNAVVNFKIIMFAIPIILLIISALFYEKKVTLTEDKHREIMEKLEEKWVEINK